MKALTLWQPWASLWALQIKRNETRSWATNHRGPLAIHAGKGFNRESIMLFYNEPTKTILREAGYELLSMMPPFFRDAERAQKRPLLGCIIAVCDGVTCQPTEIALRSIAPERRFLETAFGDYSPRRFAWTPTNMRMLEKPIPCTGHQGLWDWNEAGFASFAETA